MIATEQKFSILSDILGVREDVPNIKLHNAYSPRSENMVLRYGDARRVRARAKELLEIAYTTGTISVTNGSATVTGSGTSWYTSATHYPAWGSDDAQAGRSITIDSVAYTIKSVDSATQITLTANYAGSTASGLSYSIGTAGEKVQTPDGNVIIKYHSHVAEDATQYYFGRTKNHIYLWSHAWSVWIDKTLAGGFSDATCVDIESFNAKVLMTDGVNKFIYWAEATPNNLFDCVGSASGLDLDGGTTYLTAAKYMTIYENYVHLGYTTEGGETYPYRDRWCSHEAETDWDESGSGDTGAKDFIETSDVLMGYGHYTAGGANLLIVFKKYRSYDMWLVEGDSVFETSICNPKVGLLARHAVTNDRDGELYYAGSDYTIRKCKRGVISDGVDKTLKSINFTYQDNIEATFANEYNHILFSIPSSAGSTGNDKVLAFDVKHKTWHPLPFPIRAFGTYWRQSSYTIDTIPYDSIDEIGWDSIDAIENVVGFALDMVSDYSGYSYSLYGAESDDGSSYNGTLVLSTDLANKAALAIFKRITNMQFLFFSEGENDYSVAVSVKEDNGANWESLGSVSLNGTAEIITVDLPCDLRQKHLLLKLIGANRFRFLGVVFEFEWDGDR